MYFTYHLVLWLWWYLWCLLFAVPALFGMWEPLLTGLIYRTYHDEALGKLLDGTY